MYQDPKRVRTRYAALNLDQYEAQLIDALVDYTGIERASLLRQLVLKVNIFYYLSILSIDRSFLISSIQSL